MKNTTKIDTFRFDKSNNKVINIRTKEVIDINVYLGIKKG